jgi:hypothetical protein
MVSQGERVGEGERIDDPEQSAGEENIAFYRRVYDCAKSH